MILINVNKKFPEKVSYRDGSEWPEYKALKPYVFQFPDKLAEQLIKRPGVWKIPTANELEKIKEEIKQSIIDSKESEISSLEDKTGEQLNLIDDPANDEILQRKADGEDVTGQKEDQQKDIDQARKDGAKLSYDEKIRFITRNQDKLNLKEAIKPAFADLDPEIKTKVVVGNLSRKDTYIKSLPKLQGQEGSEKIIDELYQKIVG